MVTSLYDHNTPIIYCSLHASIALYITHIKFTYTVTSLTSTLIKSVKCYKNDYHEKNEKIQHMYHYRSAQLLYIHNVLVYNKRHYFHQCSLTDTPFMRSTCIIIIISTQYRQMYTIYKL